MIGQRLLSLIETDYLESVGQALLLEIIGSYLTLSNDVDGFIEGNICKQRLHIQAGHYQMVIFPIQH